jgi:RHS repeat-associated protein
VGNRIAHSKTTGAWTYDANNRLIQRGTSVNVTFYQYDEAGNLTQQSEPGKTTRYAYDTQNRLIEVRDGGDNLLARYGYDPQNRRIWKETYSAGKGRRTYYLYADEGLIAESAQAITLNTDGTVTAAMTPQITTQYGPRPGSEFTTGILFVKTRDSNGQDRFAYHHHDHLGTPIQATDTAGNIVWSANYEPFGKASITTYAATADRPTITLNLRLPGQYEDAETGLHYNFWRYYDPETGRYVQSDPIGLRGGINTYSYVNGQPTSFTDPLGLECTAQNGRVTCNVPGGPQINFPQPSGWPSSIKPGDSNYHDYNKWRNAEGIDKKCLEDYLRNHPTPGYPKPATPAGTPNDATPSWASPFTYSPVVSYSMSYNGSQVVVNVTMPGHPLFPGYVARTASGNIINNFGEGTGWLQNTNVPFNDLLINNVWYGLTDEAIKACSCKAQE